MQPHGCVYANCIFQFSYSVKNFINTFYKRQSLLYKVLLYLASVAVIVYLFPKGGQFKYDFSNGQLWKYDNLYAPFDFAIQKTADEIASEKKEITANAIQYFDYDTKIVTEVKETFVKKIYSINAKDSLTDEEVKSLKRIGEKVLQKVYEQGFLEDLITDVIARNDEIIALKKDKVVTDVLFKNLLTTKDILSIINTSLGKKPYDFKQEILLSILVNSIKPNVFYDKEFTTKIINNQLKNISLTQGKVATGELIILKGGIVEGKKLAILNSLKAESKSKIWTESNYNWIVLGYTILVSLALLMLLLFLHKYRIEIFNNNNKVTFIFFNVFAIIFVQTLVIKYNSDYLYVVPLSILPIIIKAFFDARLGLFTHVLTVLLLGYIVPNSFEFIYLHIIAGIVTILTVSELYKRANLFISVAQITFIYMLTYFAFSVIKEGNASQLNFLIIIKAKQK